MLERVIDPARNAPSGTNRQPVRFPNFSYHRIPGRKSPKATWR